MSDLYKPNQWIAAILGFFVQPLGILYVARLKLAAIYFLLGIALGLSEFVLRHSGQLPLPEFFSFNLLLAIACSVHAYILAKRSEPVTKRPWYSRWYGLIGIWVPVFAVIFCFRAFFYEPFTLPSASMMPTIEKGAILLTQKIGYGNYGTYGISLLKLGPNVEIHRGDILVFELPGNSSVLYTKRVIGLPGDIIRYKSKKLFVTGISTATRQIASREEYVILEEKLGDVAYTVMNSLSERPYDMEIRVPERSYFVLGDNRDHSNDSRYWGFVPEKNIVGKVIHVLQKKPE